MLEPLLRREELVQDYVEGLAQGYAALVRPDNWETCDACADRCPNPGNCPCAPCQAGIGTCWCAGDGDDDGDGAGDDGTDRAFADRAAADADKAAQQARASKYGIGIKDGGNVTKPKRWAAVKDGSFADPTNFRYPMHTPENARAALSYWGQGRNRKAYNSSEVAIITRRMRKLAKKQGVQPSDDRSFAELSMTIRAGANAGAPGANPNKPPNIPDDRPTSPSAKAGVKRVRKALKALKSLPPVDQGSGRIAVPFKFAKKVPVSITADQIAGAVRQSVPVEDVLAAEPTVVRKRVKKFIKQAGGWSPVPVVMQVGDKYIIGNGHTRFTAAWLLNLSKIDANVIGTSGK